MIYELRREYKVTELCEMAGLSRSTYYYHAAQQETVDKYASVKAAITQIYHENKGRYGYRRITLVLHTRGYEVNHKTVQRLMKELNIHCLVRPKRYCSYKGELGKIAPNLLNREFVAVQPNKKWTTDITEFKIFGQKLYLSPIMDLYNGEIISYDLSERAQFSQVEHMLDKAFQKIPDKTNLILHSDQGWQYQMKKYQKRLLDKGIRQSMSRKGNCYDNAAMENFFGHLKSELIYLQKYTDIECLKVAIHDYISYYNNDRIKMKLGGLSPIRYRQLHESVA